MGFVRSFVTSPRNLAQSQPPLAIFVCGPSGSGKSTLCQKLVDPQGGQEHLFPTGVSDEDVTKTCKEHTFFASAHSRQVTVVDMPGHDHKALMIPDKYRDHHAIAVIILALTEKKKPVVDLCAKLNVRFDDCNVFISPRVGPNIKASAWLKSNEDLLKAIVNKNLLKMFRQQPRVQQAPMPPMPLPAPAHSAHHARYALKIVPQDLFLCV